MRASTRGTGELIAAALRAGARRVIVGVGGSATTDGGLAALEALGWSFGAIPVTVACDVSTPFLDAATVFAPAEGRDRGAGRAAHPPPRAASPTSTSSGPGSTCASCRAPVRPVGSPVASPRSAPSSSRASTSSPARPGLKTALDGVDLVVTGEGRLDATSFEGKVVGGVLEWATDAGVAARRR